MAEGFIMGAEAIRGSAIQDLPRTDRFVLAMFRVVAASAGRCCTIQHVLWSMLGELGASAHGGLSIMAAQLPAESRRRLTLGHPSSEQFTWDEVAVLATLAAAQSADSANIATWLQRLGVSAPSQQLQYGLACTAAALLHGGFPVSRDIGDLCRARPVMDVERRTTTH